MLFARKALSEASALAEREHPSVKHRADTDLEMILAATFRSASKL